MQQKRIIPVVLLLVIGVGVALWLRLESDSMPFTTAQTVEGDGAGLGGKPVQTSNGVLQQSSEWERRWLAARNSQDLDSVVLAFKQATDCLAYHDAVSKIQSMAKDNGLDDLSEETLSTLRNMDASSARHALLVQRLDGFCKGSDKNQLVQAFSSAVLDAALKGSPDAQTCFILMGPSAWQGSGSIPNADTIFRRHIQYTPEFTQKALERADPRVAVRSLYRYVASPQGHASWTDGLPKPDPALTWRAARLASLRAGPEQRADIEQELTVLGEMGVLSAEVIAEADDWAKRTFNAQFVGQAPINLDSPVPCYSSPDLAP